MAIAKAMLLSSRFHIYTPFLTLSLQSTITYQQSQPLRSSTLPSVLDAPFDSRRSLRFSTLPSVLNPRRRFGQRLGGYWRFKEVEDGAALSSAGLVIVELG